MPTASAPMSARPTTPMSHSGKPLMLAAIHVAGSSVGSDGPAGWAAGVLVGVAATVEESATMSGCAGGTVSVAVVLSVGGAASAVAVEVSGVAGAALVSGVAGAAGSGA